MQHSRPSGSPISLVVIALLALLLIHFNALAYSEDIEKNIADAEEAAMRVAKVGPTKIMLGHQAILDLPKDMLFIPSPQADRYMQAYGNSKDDNLMGLVLSVDETSDWIVAIDFNKTGYIKDDDAKKWDTDKLLQNLKDGTEEGNKERRKHGFKEFIITGWAEVPKYDASRHRLVWSALLQNKNENTENPVVNYNTYALGREGYISMDLITGMQELQTDKQAALTLLDNTHYLAGKRYSDFNPSIDRIAEYGLAALIAGVAAKKLGLFAILIAFALKFIKVILIGAALVIGGLVKLFTGKKTHPPSEH